MPAVKSTRRTFLKRTAQVAGGATVPLILPKPCSGVPASERLRVGCIGIGGRGTYVGNNACSLGEKVACADVDRQHAERFAGDGPCEIYSDYRRLLDRKDIDVVTIGTPDHWHTRILIDAVKAGKDVYCEKPLTLTIDEGKKICQAVKETKRIVQVGTQQRSSSQFLMAIALAHSGRLGDVLTATCEIPPGRSKGPFPTAKTPVYLDWDVWLGQCPKVPYTPERCHGSFRSWLEYSGGIVTDWGAHQVDIGLWALGFDRSGPVASEGVGNFPSIPDDVNIVDHFAGKHVLPNAYNTAIEFDATHTFENGSKLILTHRGRNGVMIEGDKGRIYVNRGRLTGKPVEDLTKAERDQLADATVKLYRKKIDPFDVQTEGTNSGIDRASMEHMKNFFACVKDRSKPISDVFTHHRSVSLCHLSNISMLLRRKLAWDPNKEDFVGDQQASSLVSRPQRAPYTIEV